MSDDLRAAAVAALAAVIDEPARGNLIAHELLAALAADGWAFVNERTLAAAIDAVWPKHYEGTASMPPSPHDSSYLVDDIYGAKPDAAAILHALTQPDTRSEP